MGERPVGRGGLAAGSAEKVTISAVVELSGRQVDRRLRRSG